MSVEPRMPSAPTEGGDVESFTALFVEVEPKLRRALIARYGVERGREAAAEALAWAWEHRAELAEVRRPLAYLYRVGQSRSRARRSRPVFERATGEDPLVEPRLAAALARLSDRQRVALLLVHGAQWTHAEVAELLGLKVATVQTHVERGRARLRQLLEVEE